MTIKMRAALGLIFFFISAAADARNLHYNREVMLEGVLTFPTADPKVTFCDKTHQFPAIKLQEAIAVVCEPMDNGCQLESGIDLVQLVLKKAEMAKFKKMIGKRGRVTGTLYHAEGGHDFTSVLMNVNSIGW